MGTVDVKPDPWQRLVAIGSILSVLLVAIGLYSTNEANRQTSEANREQQRLTEQGQITDRFTKAVEQLGQPGPEKVDVRLGAIYALERIMRDSAVDHPAVVSVLTSFIRVHAPVDPATTRNPKPVSQAHKPPSPPVDVQAALTVLGHRDATRDQGRLDLTDANLTGANLTGANLAGATLTGANLNRANLRSRLDIDMPHVVARSSLDVDLSSLPGVNLTGADLTDADLTDADLTGAGLTDANLTGANLTGANLYHTTLTRANLTGANLNRADLLSANLTGADLLNATLNRADLLSANLTGAILLRANLTSANLISADLTGATLTGATLTGATLNRTTLTRANLTDANLTDANLTDANLTAVNLRCARTNARTQLPLGVVWPAPCG
ncbi:pentapeptide repeat-containing protein [Micromonospora sp. WMMD730]|uniref:pentapeptide repeat-containing protein n=1 Tax=Micromonospora sp. WMMD730 TaxID=3404128 RepID=UPI003B9547D8